MQACINVYHDFHRGQYMTILVGFGYDKLEQEKQARMPILLPQFNGILQVGILEWTVQCLIILYTMV